MREVLTGGSVVHGEGSLTVFGGVPRGAVVRAGSDIVVFGQCAAASAAFLCSQPDSCALKVCAACRGSSARATTVALQHMHLPKCSLWPCWFRLQGEAHAGIGGARDARVAALALTPQRLSVAGIGAYNYTSTYDTRLARHVLLGPARDTCTATQLLAHRDMEGHA